MNIRYGYSNYLPHVLEGETKEILLSSIRGSLKRAVCEKIPDEWINEEIKDGPIPVSDMCLSVEIFSKERFNFIMNYLDSCLGKDEMEHLLGLIDEK